MIGTPAVPDPGLREQFSRVNAKLDLIAGDVTEAGYVRLGLAEVNSRLDCLDERVAQIAGGSTWRTLRPARDRIVEIGRELILAKEEVDHGQWLPHDKGEERPYRGAPAPA